MDEEIPRGKRPSTAQATERQLEIELQRKEISKLKRKSAQLKKIVEQEETSLVESAIDLARFAKRQSETPSEELLPSPEIRTIEQGAEGVTIETLEADATSDVESDIDEDVFEESESEWDPLGAAKTPRKTSGTSSNLQIWPPRGS